MVFSIPRGTAILLPFFLSCKRKPSCKSTREGFKMRLACDKEGGGNGGGNNVCVALFIREQAVCACAASRKRTAVEMGQRFFLVSAFGPRPIFLARRREELLVSFFLGWASGGFLVPSFPPLFIKCRFSPPPLPPPFSLSRRRRRLS